MKAVETEACNLTLELPGAGKDRNLPAQVIKAFDPELGQTPDEAHDAILTLWRPDDGERKALANGALIELVVTGTAHPPVSLGVGNPDELNALLSKAHVDRAVGAFFARLSEKLEGEAGLGTPEEVLELWSKSLEDTKDGEAAVDLGERIEDLRGKIAEEAEPKANGADPE